MFKALTLSATTDPKVLASVGVTEINAPSRYADDILGQLHASRLDDVDSSARPKILGEQQVWLDCRLVIVRHVIIIPTDYICIHDQARS